VKDGFCTIHHPDTVRKRELAKEARFKAKMKQHLAPFERIEKLERELAAAESRLREARELIHHNEFSHDYEKDVKACAVCAKLKRIDAAIAAPAGDRQ
jgi:hypothetical protein